MDVSNLSAGPDGGVNWPPSPQGARELAAEF